MAVLLADRFSLVFGDLRGQLPPYAYKDIAALLAEEQKRWKIELSLPESSYRLRKTLETFGIFSATKKDLLVVPTTLVASIRSSREPPTERHLDELLLQAIARAAALCASKKPRETAERVLTGNQDSRSLKPFERAINQLTVTNWEEIYYQALVSGYKENANPLGLRQNETLTRELRESLLALLKN
jgi:hypothetical protein